MIVRYDDAETGKTVYTGKPKSPEDFADTDDDGAGDPASEDFQVIKVYKNDGSIQLIGGGGRTHPRAGSSAPPARRFGPGSRARCCWLLLSSYRCPPVLALAQGLVHGWVSVIVDVRLVLVLAVRILMWRMRVLNRRVVVVVLVSRDEMLDLPARAMMHVMSH